MYIGKVVRLLMLSGKKSSVGLRPLDTKGSTLVTAFAFRYKPLVVTKRVRKGSRFYDTPTPITSKASLRTLVKWIAGGGVLTKSKTERTKAAANMVHAHFRWR